MQLLATDPIFESIFEWSNLPVFMQYIPHGFPIPPPPDLFFPPNCICLHQALKRSSLYYIRPLMPPKILSLKQCEQLYNFVIYEIHFFIYGLGS